MNAVALKYAPRAMNINPRSNLRVSNAPELLNDFRHIFNTTFIRCMHDRDTHIRIVVEQLNGSLLD